MLISSKSAALHQKTRALVLHVVFAKMLLLSKYFLVIGYFFYARAFEIGKKVYSDLFEYMWFGTQCLGIDICFILFL